MDQNHSEPADAGRIEALADLRLTPSPVFMEQLRRRIDRCDLTADLVGMAFVHPIRILIAFVTSMSFVAGSWARGNREAKQWRDNSP